MADEDYTQTMRSIDELQDRLDKVFNRVNADPIYATEQAIANAISDNPRYFAEDRKNELAEIFFAILDQVYDRIVKQDKVNPFCNPMIPPGSKPRLPEPEMLMRTMMPLAWALQLKWAAPELADTVDTYFQSFKENEAKILYDTLVFLTDLFPEIRDTDTCSEFLEYWRKLATERDSMRDETAEDKSFLLGILMQKKNEMDARRKA